MYFDYSFASEDTNLEVSMLRTGCENVVVIAGSGSRVLPLLSKCPRRLTCVDVSEPQLCLAQLRLGALKELEYDQFLQLMGYESIPAAVRKQLFEKISLAEPYHSYIRHVFTKLGWESLLMAGRWERAHLSYSRIIRSILGTRIDQLFECDTLDDQRYYIEHIFPRARWNLALRVLSAITGLNGFLFKNRMISKNIDVSLYKFFQQYFDKLFAENLAKDNFYLNFLLLGDLVHSHARPIEAHFDVFSDAKKGIQDCEIKWRHANIIDVAREEDRKFGFVSFSNVPSYFREPTEQRFLQQIKGGVAEDGLVVTRNYIRVPFRLDTLGFENITSLFQHAISAEKTQMYLVDVFWRLKTDI